MRGPRNVESAAPTGRASNADPFARTVLDYAHNLVVGGELFNRAHRRWRADPVDVHLLVNLLGVRQRPKDGPVTHADRVRTALNAYQRRARGTLRRPAPPDEPVRQNLATVARIVGLLPADTGVLQLLLAHAFSRELKQLASCAGDLSFMAAARLVSVATAGPLRVARAALSPRGSLIESGLVTLDGRMCELDNKVELKTALLDLVLSPGLSRRRFLGEVSPRGAAAHADGGGLPDRAARRRRLRTRRTSTTSSRLVDHALAGRMGSCHFDTMKEPQ